MWAALLPILLPIVESLAWSAGGWALAHWGPYLGITPAEGAALAAAVGKLLPSNTTAAVVPAVATKL